MAALCSTALPPSLNLLVPPLRLVSASMWQVAQHRQVKNYTKVEEFVSVVLELVPSLLSTKERIELLLGLRTKVILELCRGDPSITVQMMQPHFKRLAKISESTSSERDMCQKVDAAVRNFVDLIQALVKKPGYRRRYFQDTYPLHYGQKFDTALQSLVWEFLSRLEMLLPVPSFHQVAAWFDESPLILEDFLQMVHDPKPIQVLLDHCKDLTRLSGSSSHVMPDTILSTLSGTHCPDVQAALSRKPAEKCVSAPHDPHSSLNESDSHGDSNDEDCSGDVDEGDPQRDSDEGQNDTSQHDQQSDPEQSSQTPFSEKQVNGTNELNGYRGAGERTANNDEGKDTVSTEENGLQDSFHKVPIYPGTTGALKCTECGRAFDSESLLRKHKEAHTKEKSEPQNNETVVSTGHQPENTAAHTPRLHPCSKCNNIFNSKCSLENHQRVHTRQGRHLCSYCGQTYHDKFKLDAHIRTHTGERPFVCSVCGKRFNYRGLFILHNRIHTGEKPYLCSYCGKDFTSQGALMLHTRTHTGERPYKCEFCPKTFTMSCHLTKHRRVHTREKPYTCPVCSKRFAQHDGLKKHVRIHTGEKPYECLECGKRFAVRCNMKVHQRVHRKKENQLPFSSK